MLYPEIPLFNKKGELVDIKNYPDSPTWKDELLRTEQIIDDLFAEYKLLMKQDDDKH